MKIKRFLALLLAAGMLFALLAACDDVPEVIEGEPGENGEEEIIETPETGLPRNETLYVNGLQWGMSNGWNVFGDNMNNPLINDQAGGGARLPMFETPYMYNPLDNKMYPLLAAGGVDGYSWNSDMTQLTYKIKPAAMWSDGTKITAHDAAFTYMAGFDYSTDGNVGFAAFIESVVALDDETVAINAVLTDDGRATNPLMMITFLGQNYILQKAWLEDLISRNGNDIDRISQDPGEDIVYSGPYGPHLRNEVVTAVIRNDDYWGKDASMWGKLPTPKYLACIIFANNASGDAAFENGEVDVSQQFIANVHLMWLERGLPVSTFIDSPPYGLCVNMPTAYFNMNIPLLRDNVAIRKAIAMAVDYDMINANAMTGQSPTFRDVPRSLMAPTPGEQAMYNKAAVAHLQWAGSDIAGANALLDEAGFTERDTAGFRTHNGQRLSFRALCPQGWSDWEMSMEIVAAAGAEIGIEITTEFPDWDVYQNVVTAEYHDDYEIFMMWTSSTDPTQPWGRARGLMSSEFVGVASNWAGNWGHYVNPRADELIMAIPLEADNAKVIEMYTELVEIYLTDVPSFSLMYRPDKFHAVNETVWTGFTDINDGRNVPPINAISGYAISDLYNLRLVNP